MDDSHVDLSRAVLSCATRKAIECLMQRDLAISIKHSTPEQVRQIVLQGGEIGRTGGPETFSANCLANSLEARPL